VPNQDNVAISIRFANGSVGQIAYAACGDKSVNKERIEVFGGGRVFIIDDFQTGESHVGGYSKNIKLRGKGHQEEIESFCDAIRKGAPSPISLGSLFFTTAVTFAILDSLRTGLPQAVLPFDKYKQSEC
jgi:polar amino acid transport system substrate-binding protein